MRILLIEDHAIFREALRELLHAKDPSFEVVAEAATAHDACQAAEEHHQHGDERQDDGGGHRAVVEQACDAGEPLFDELAECRSDLHVPAGDVESHKP